MSKPELHERIRAVRQFSRFYTRKIGVLRDGLLCHDRRYRPGMVGAGRRKDGSLTCMGVFLSSGFLFVAGSLFGAERPFLVPSPAIRFAERAERCQGTEMLAQLSGFAA